MQELIWDVVSKVEAYIAFEALKALFKYVKSKLKKLRGFFKKTRYNSLSKKISQLSTYYKKATFFLTPLPVSHL
jgi:hypothetical protein